MAHYPSLNYIQVNQIIWFDRSINQISIYIYTFRYCTVYQLNSMQNVSSIYCSSISTGMVHPFSHLGMCKKTMNTKPIFPCHSMHTMLTLYIIIIFFCKWPHVENTRINVKMDNIIITAHSEKYIQFICTVGPPPTKPVFVNVFTWAIA